ncbi:transketolase C-terminal domain-containing protein, partial [Micrococcus sp. SIMBA_131]
GWARAAAGRGGTAVSLVSDGPSAPTGRAAPHAAAEEGLSVEVVDLRTGQRLDEDTMTAADAKAGRAVGVASPPGCA